MKISSSTSTFSLFPFFETSDIPRKIDDAFQRPEVKEAIEAMQQDDFARAIEILQNNPSRDKAVQHVHNYIIDICERILADQA